MSKQKLVVIIIAVVSLVIVGAIIYTTNQAPKTEDLAARVNGVPIYRADYERQLSTLEESTKLQYSSSELEARSEELKKLTIDRLVDLELSRQMAHDAGVKVSDEEVEEQYQALVEESGGEDALAQSLKAQGLTQASYREQIRTQLLVDTYLKSFSTDTQASTEDARSEYERNPENYTDDKGNQLPFDQVKDQILSMLTKENETAAFNKKLDSFKKSSDIEIFVLDDKTS